MAQKINPIAVRLHLNRKSDSSWFSDYYYAHLLYQDGNVVNYLSAIRQPTSNKLGFRPGRCVLHHYPKRSLIHLFCLGNQRPSLKQAPKYSYENLLPFVVKQSKIWEEVKRIDPRDHTRSNDKSKQDSTLAPLQLHVQHNSRRGRSLASLVEQRAKQKESGGHTHAPDRGMIPDRRMSVGFAPMLDRERVCVPGWSNTDSISLREANQRLTVLPQADRRKVAALRASGRRHEVQSVHSALAMPELFDKSGWTGTALKAVQTPSSWPVSAEVQNLSVGSKLLQRSSSCQDHRDIPTDFLSREDPKNLGSTGQIDSTLRPKGAHQLNAGSACLKWFVMQYCFQLNTHCDVESTLQYIQPKGIKAKYLQLCLAKSRHYYLSNIQTILSSQSDTLTSIIPMKVTSVYQSASLVAQEISCKLEQTKSFRQICRTIFKEIELCNYIKGIRIACSGRLNGAEIAKTECKQYGETSLHVFSDQIDYAYTKASTPYGILGVKVWICYL
jgi:Ribosomal protein S3, C-terminal domain